MNRFFTSSALLAACMVLAACGSSSSSGNGNTAALTGNYAFQEQIYTYYSGVAVSGSAPRGLAARAVHHVDNFARRSTAIANAKSHAHASNMHAVPQQGDLNSSVDWGAMVGSLTFDGQGNVTGGEIDFNEPLGGGYFADTVSGIYTINSDNTGTIELISNNVGAQFFYDIALQGSVNGSVATGMQFTEGQSDSLGDIEIGTGNMLQQSGSLAQASITGNYVFGLQGQTCYGCAQVSQGDLYLAGVLAANGSGTFGSGGEADISTGFDTDNQVAVTGSYIAPDASGRVTASLSTTGYANGALPGGYAIYIANSSTFYILSTDQSSSTTAAAYVFGQAGLQSGSFSSSSLAGNYVLSESTEDLANESTPDTYSDTYLALLAASGTTLTGTGDSNKAGAITSDVAYNYGTYTVASNGRVTLSGTTPSGAAAPVFWLQSSGFGYGVDQLNGFSGLQEPGLLSLYGQTGSSFTASSLSGLYAVGTLPASTSLAGLATATVSADGTSALSGNAIVNSLGNNSVVNANGSYTIAGSGRGTTTGSASSSLFANDVIYIISPNQAVAMDVTSSDTAPSVQYLHQ